MRITLIVVVLTVLSVACSSQSIQVKPELSGIVEDINKSQSAKFGECVINSDTVVVQKDGSIVVGDAGKKVIVELLDSEEPHIAKADSVFVNYCSGKFVMNLHNCDISQGERDGFWCKTLNLVITEDDLK